MKIGKMFRWYWQNTYWGLVGFYGAMLFLMLLGFVIMVFSSTEEVSVNGFAFSAEIMLLVMGIIFFPAGTRFGLSNGVSRKTVFCGMVLFLLALSCPVLIYELTVPKPGLFVFVGRQSLSPLFSEKIVVMICRFRNYRYVFS